MKINDQVHNYLDERKTKNKRLSATALLSLLIALAVVASLISPAVSMTLEQYYRTNPGAVSTIDDNAWTLLQAGTENGNVITDAYDYAPAGGKDFGSYITKAEMSNLQDKGDGTKSALFTIEYSFPSGSGIGSDGTAYIYYQIPENIYIQSDYAGESCKVKDFDDGWAKSEAGIAADGLSGYYSIDENGMMVIKFTPEYLKYIDEHNGAVKGAISFSGEIRRNDTADGDQTIDFGGHKINVEFEDKNLSANKSGTPKFDTSGNPYAVWTITINNPGKYADLNNATLTDTMFPADTTNITVNPSDVGSFDNGAFTFNANANQNEQIIFTYTTVVTKDTNSVTNEAYLKYGDNQTISMTKTVPFDLNSIKGKITKSGIASYDKQGDNKEFGYIEWTVEAYREYGVSVNGYVVQDDAFANLGSDNNNKLVSVQDTNGNDVAYTLSGDKMTINSDTDRVKIIYRTPVTSEYQKVSNTASITPPDSDTPDDSFTTPEVEYNQKSKYNFSKAAVGDTDKSVTWKITVEWINGSMNLEGSVITDDAFKYIDTLTNANVLIMREGWQTVDESNELSLLQKTGDDSFTIVSANGIDKISKVEITYEVPLTDEQIQQRLNGDITVENTADFYPGGSEPKSEASASRYLGKLQNSLTKRLTSTTASESKNDFYEGESDDGRFDNRELSWQVEVGKFDGFSGSNITLLDSPYVSGGGKHYIIPNEADIVVKGRTSTGSYTTLTEGTDYTVKYYVKNEDNTKTEVSGSTEANYFEIVFNQSVDDNNYTYVLVDYKTVAEVSSLEIPEGSSSVTAVYDNTVGIGNLTATSEQKYSFTKNDPYNVPKLSITGNKDWGTTPENNRFNVRFQLQVKKGDNGTWSAYEADGVTNPQTLEVGTTSCTWNDLPQYEAAIGETKYYYRVVELDADGNPIEPNGTIKNSNDIFNVTYDNNYTNGINNTGSLTITNTWDCMNLTVTKQWIDRGNTDDRPETIYVELLKQVESSDWESEGAKVALTKDNNYTYTWYNLPKKTEDGKTIKYSAWEFKRDGNTDTKFADYIPTSYDKTGTTDTGTVYVENTWKYMNLSLSKQWEGGTDSNKPDTITVQLYRVTSNGTEIPISGVDTDGSLKEGFAPVTLNKSDNYAYKWEKLLRYEACSSSTDCDLKSSFHGNAEYYNEVKYVVKEVESDGKGGYIVKAPSGYVQHWEESTSNGSTGSVKLTNEYNGITLSAEKNWAGEKNNDTSSRPETITIHLYRKLPTDDEFKDMGDDYVKTVNTKDAYNNWSNCYVSWENLPKYDENGKEILYKAVEEDVDGYIASYKTEKHQYDGDSYNYDENGTNLDGDKFIITNTLLPKLEKYPVTADELTNINGNNAEYNSTKITNNTITSDQLKNWTVKDVDTNGDGVNESCYLFRWRIDIDGATYYTPDNGNQIVDTLPEGSVLYESSTDGYDVAAQENYKSGNSVEMLHGTKSDWQNYTYDKSTNTVTFRMQNRKFITYCIAIPKSIVDSQVDANGSYVISNSAKLEDNSATTGASLTINKDMTIRPDESLLDKNYIVKDSNSELAQSKYSIIVNPDGKTISSDGTIDIHDIFTITGYMPPNGTRTDGSDLLDAELSYVAIYESDANGNAGRQLGISEYSYRDETKVITEVTRETWSYASQVRITNGWQNNFNIYGDNPTVGYPKGLQIEFEISGTPNADLIVTESSSKIDVVPDGTSKTFDENGKGIITIETLQDIEQWGLYESLSVSNVDYTVAGTIKSAEIVTTTVETQNQLTLTVPDSKALLIEYYYDLKTNANTPGNPTIGQMPPDGSTIYMKNKASLDTYLGTVTDSTDENSILVKKATATSSTASSSKIRKRDVGDYSYTDLSAEFIIAKWDTANSKWVYASEFTEATDSNGITSSSIGYTKNLTESDNKPPAEAAEFEIISGEKNITFISGTLYKIIETTAPNGYQSTNWSTTATLDDMAEFTTYVMYDGSLPTTLPSDVKAADIVYVRQNGAVTIYNNRLIDIGAEKTWVPAPSTGAENMSIEVKLYWSYTKSSAIPSDAKPVDGADTAKLTAQKQSDGTYIWKQEVIWKDVPNGKDGKPIYYYVREESYTVDGITYTYDSTSGNYMNGTSKGPYQPTYTNNAVNADGIVSISNSEGLFVKKQWLRADNSVMENPPESSIGFRLYGVKDGQLTAQPIYTGNVTSPDWLVKVELPSDAEHQLSYYDSFIIEEVITTEQAQGSLYGYSFSQTYNITNGTGAGEITLINKDPLPVNINVTANKVWGFGATPTDYVNVTLLYSVGDVNYSTKEVSQFDLNNLPTGVYIYGDQLNCTKSLTENGNWTYTWKDLPFRNNNNEYYHYYVLEINVSDGLEAVYSYNGNGSMPVYTITNQVPATYEVDKKWVNSAGETVTSGLPESITIDLYKRAKIPPTELPDGLSVIALGDSITRGGYNNVDENYRYPNVLQANLISNGSSGAVVKNYGIDQQQIPQFTERLGQITELASANVICILGGTNDVHQERKIDANGKSYAAVTDDNTELISERLQELIDAIREINPNIVVFVGTIPYFDIVDDKGNTTTGGGWWGGKTQEESNARIDSANSYIKELASVDNKIFIADVNAAVDHDTMLIDGCHPNANGYAAIADTFYKAINKYYTGAETADTGVVENITGLPDDFLVDGEIDTSLYTKHGSYTIDATSGWKLTLTDLPMEDADGHDYVYYAVENPVINGWITSYEGNGQLYKGYTPVVITNTKTIKTLDFTVKKTWNDNNDSSGRSLSLRLQRKIEGGTWADYEFATPTPTQNGSVWTYSYEKLPGEDANGNSYYYRVVETSPSGYILSKEENNDGISAESADKEIRLTNTKSVSLKIKKLWSAVNNNNEVTLELHRSTTPNDNSDLPLIFTVSPETVTVSLEKTETVTASNSVQSVKSASENIASATFDGKIITITGISVGTTTITVKDVNGSEKTITVNVTDKPQFSVTPKNVTLTLGSTESRQLTAMLGDNIVTPNYSVTSGDCVTVSNGLITAVKAGTATITATYSDGTDSYTDTVNVEVKLPTSFALTGSSHEVAEGSTLQLTPEPNYGTFTYSSATPSVATVDSNSGLVTGVSQGTAVITATRNDGKTATFEVTVTEASSVATGTATFTSTENRVTIPSNGRKVVSIELSATTDIKEWDEIGVILNDGTNTAHFKAYLYGTWKTETSTGDKDKDTPANTLGSGYTLEATESGLKVTFDPAFDSDVIIRMYDAYVQGRVFPIDYVITYESGSSATPTPTINLTPETSTINIGETVQFSAATANTTGSVSYSVNDTSIATIDSSGKLTALKPGNVTVTAKVDGVSDTASVTVREPTVTLTASPTTIKVGETAGLGVTVTNGSSPSSISYSVASDDSTIAEIVDNNKVKGLAQGTATVNAEIKIGNVTYNRSVEVTVTEESKPVLVIGDVDLQSGNSATLALDAKTTGLLGDEVIKYRVASGDDGVATIDGNTVTANGAGIISYVAYIENPDGSDYAVSAPAMVKVSKNLTFDSNVGEYVKLNFTLSEGNSYTNGCLGFSVYYNGISYWVQYKWEARSSGDLTVDLTSDNVQVTYNNGSNTVTDEATISQILAMVPQSTSCEIQMWWTEAGNSIKLNSYSYDKPAETTTTTAELVGPTIQTTTTTTVELFTVEPNVEFSVSATSLWVGETAELSSIVGSVENPVVSYEFMDIDTGSTYAAIDGNTLTAKAVGTFAIRARYQYGTDTNGTELYAYSEKIPITISAVPEFTLTISDNELITSETATLTVSDGFLGQTVTYLPASGDIRQVNVSGNEIEAVGAGTIKLVASCTRNGATYKSNEVSVTITAKEIPITDSGTTSTTEYFAIPACSASKYLFATIDVDRSREISSIVVENGSINSTNRIRFFYEDLGDTFDSGNYDTVEFYVGNHVESTSLSRFPTSLDKIYIVLQSGCQGGKIKVTVNYTDATSVTYSTATQSADITSVSLDESVEFSTQIVNITDDNDTYSSIMSESYNVTITDTDANNEANNEVESETSGTQLQSASYLLPIVSSGEEEAASPVFVNDVYTFKITSTEDSDGAWIETISNLPMYDENGNVYYYWIVEDKSTAPGYEPTYSFPGDTNDGTLYCVKADELKTDDSPHMTVLNTAKTTSGVVMPSTGGEGTMKFYYTGGAMILLSLFVGGNRIRRRSKERRRQ